MTDTNNSSIEAIVVGGIDHGEANRVVYLMTHDGRMSCFAPSARKSRRRFSGALDPFTTITAELHHGRNKGLPTLKSTVVSSSRLGIRESLERIAIASYASEMISVVAPEGAPTEELYELLTRVLDRVDDPATTISPALRRAFELCLLDALGYRPNLSECVDSGAPLEDVAYLDLRRGGLFSLPERGGARPVGPKTVEWMRRVLATEPVDELSGLDADWANTAAKKLGGAFADFFEQLLGRSLKSEALLASLELDSA